MPQPTLKEYQDAIQRPDLCFKDPDLRDGVSVSGVFGLPKVISGGFAGVFQINNGGRSFAARCFLKDVKDIKRRYKAIYDFLHRKRIKCVVKFEYIDEGILVNGKWYPILKMEWLEGETLASYVERHVRDRDVLLDTVEKFRGLVEELHGRGVSHGDLHDQNIMVVGGELRVIDYDAFYVPSLEGLRSNEVGHRNYQHPERGLDDYGPYIDHFSEWVIYISLLALVADPGIWDAVGGGDQCLLFRSSDFADINASKVFKALRQIKDEDFGLLVDSFQESIYTYSLELIPSILDEERILKTRKKGFTGVDEIPLVSLRGLEVKTGGNGSSWIWDNKDVRSERFHGGYVYGRLGIFLPLLYLFFVELLFVIGVIGWDVLRYLLLGVPVLGVMFPLGYFMQPQVRMRRDYSRRLRSLRRENEARWRKIESEKARIDRMRKRLDAEIELLKDEVGAQRRLESKTLKEAESRNWSNLHAIEEKRRELVRREAEEMESLLRQRRDEFVQSRLKKHSIRGSNIPRISLVKRVLLHGFGLGTAADFLDVTLNRTILMDAGARFSMADGSTCVVWWLNPWQIRSLRDWRNKLVRGYLEEAPVSLDRGDVEGVLGRYRRERELLEVEEGRVLKSIEDEKRMVRERFNVVIDSILGKIEDRRGVFVSEVEETQTRLDALCMVLDRASWEINRVEHMLRGYSEIDLKHYLVEALR